MIFFKTFIMIGIFIFSSMALSAVVERTFKHKDFDIASKSQNKLQFTIKSTKIGMFSSDVDGFAKNFTFRANLIGDSFKSGMIIFRIIDLDTDSDGRNEKMHNLCLSHEKFQIVMIKIPLTVKLGENMAIPSLINIRGKEKELMLKMSVVKDGASYRVMGSAIASFKALQIPDPSIFIAKVSDPIRISFSFKI